MSCLRTRLNFIKDDDRTPIGQDGFIYGTLDGTNNICIGSDLDGILYGCTGLEKLEDFNNLKTKLEKSNIESTTINKILFKNTENFIKDVLKN